MLSHNHPGYWDDLLPRLRGICPSLRAMAVSQVHVTRRFIEEGLGVSFLPLSTVAADAREGRLEIAAGEDLKLPLAHTYLLTGRLVPPVADRFARMAEAFAAESGANGRQITSEISVL